MIKDRQAERISCKECQFAQLCLAKQFSEKNMERLDRFIQKALIIDKGEHIYRYNDTVDYLYAVHSGSAKDYYIDEDGQEYINNFYFPGDILALEALPQKKYFFSAVAITQLELCMIPVNALLNEMQTFPELLNRILQINSNKMLNDKHLCPTTNAKLRIADFLVNILSRLEERYGKKDSFQLPMSQVDVSYMTGMAYETVSRVLHHLEEEEIIQVKNRQITVLNSTRLMTLGNDAKNLKQSIADKT